MALWFLNSVITRYHTSLNNEARHLLQCITNMRPAPTIRIYLKYLVWYNHNVTHNTVKFRKLIVNGFTKAKMLLSDSGTNFPFFILIPYNIENLSIFEQFHDFEILGSQKYFFSWFTLRWSILFYNVSFFK